MPSSSAFQTFRINELNHLHFRRPYYISCPVSHTRISAHTTQTYKHARTHQRGAMTAARRIWRSLLSFIVINLFTLSLRFLATNSALCSMRSRDLIYLVTQDFRPLRRVFGRSFHRSTSSVSPCDVYHDVGGTQAHQAVQYYSREGLLKIRVTGRRADGEVLNIIAHFGLFRYRGSRAGRCYRRVYDGEPRSDDGELPFPITVCVPRDCLTCKHQKLQPRRVLVYFKLEQRRITTRIGCLNCCSSRNKYSVVSDCITSSGFNLFPLLLRRGTSPPTFPVSSPVLWAATTA